MTSWGRQYPDGPLEPPPGWFSEESLRKRASVVADIEDRAWIALGEVMHALLNPEPPPGPPWTRTIAGPDPIGWDEDGMPVYPEPGPAITMTTAGGEGMGGDD